MEIDGLGKRCTLPSCRKLDYLPVRCHECHRDFCDEHALAGAHTCAVAGPRDTHSGVCPKCKMAVGIGDAAMKRHMRAMHERTDPRCAHCGGRDAFAVRCPRCQRLFCIAHRLLEVHSCVAAAPTAPQLRNGQVSTRGADDDRVNCEVRSDIDAELVPCFISISRRWSSGKILDEIAKVTGLRQKRRWLYHVDAVDSDIVQLLPHMEPVRGVVRGGDILVVSEIQPSPPRRRKRKIGDNAQLEKAVVVDLTLDDDSGSQRKVKTKRCTEIIDLT